MIRCSTVRKMARSTGNSNLRSARRSSITDPQELSRQSLSNSSGGPMRLASIVVVSPFSTAESSIALSVKRAPERTSRSSSPLALSASSRPGVATTLWRGLPSTRWLSTTWRYSNPPDRLVRKYMPASVCPHRHTRTAAEVNQYLRSYWHYKISQFEVLARQSAAFGPILGRQLSKSHLRNKVGRQDAFVPKPYTPAQVVAIIQRL